MTFGEKVDSYAVAVLNEREVRAGAGILFFVSLVVFLGAWHVDALLPAQLMIIAFFWDFLIRVIQPKYAPSLILGRIAVANQIPEYTAAAPKRFAWLIGLALAAVMLVTLIFMQHMSILNFAICAVCILLLFLESAFGICLGCLVYHKLSKQDLSLCPGGVCEVRQKETIQKINTWQMGTLVLFAAAMFLVTGVMSERNQHGDMHHAHHPFLQQLKSGNTITDSDDAPVHSAPATAPSEPIQAPTQHAPMEQHTEHAHH
jgi:hypothetical protein